MARMLIQNGFVVAADGAGPRDVLIADGTIAGLLAHGTDVPAETRIDASGLVVLPGAIDAHTHFIQNDPEIAATMDGDEREGFENGGRAAAAGGVTTVVEMPQADPPTTDGQRFRRKRELAERDAIVDFALWGGVCAGQEPSAVRDQIEAGAVGLKAFMCDSDPSFPGVDDAQLLATLEVLKDRPIMLGLHAENDALLQHGLRRERGRTDPLAHADSRPPIVEIEAVNRAIFFAEQTGGWVHIVHLSTPPAADLVKRAKLRGVRVTAETCPQYLALDLDDLVRLRGFGKCAPAIRDRQQVEALWAYVADGTIDCVTSDHCGYTIASKEAGRENIWNAPNGLSGIQTLLPVVVDEARQRGFSWEEIAQLTATAPAMLWQLAPKKGAIAVGADADLVLLDPAREWTVRTDELLHTHHWSPFEGRKVRGRVVRTILRGTTVYQDDAPERILVRPGFGQFVPAQVTGSRAGAGRSLAL